jgi:hypothetical protein
MSGDSHDEIAQIAEDIVELQESHAVHAAQMQFFMYVITGILIAGLVFWFSQRMILKIPPRWVSSVDWRTRTW